MTPQIVLGKKNSSLGKGGKEKALETIEKIKATLKAKAGYFMSVIQEYQSESEARLKEINWRNFKHFLFATASLSPYEAENLIEYFDKKSEGFIQIVDIQKILQD